MRVRGKTLGLLLYSLCTVLCLCIAGCGKPESIDGTVKLDTSQTVEGTREVQSMQGAGQIQTEEVQTEEIQTGEIQSEEVQPQNYAAVVEITINPEIRLYLDEASRVLAVEYLNQDALDAYEQLDLVGKQVTQCVEEIVTEAIEQKYLETGEAVSVAVVEVKASEVAEADICETCYQTVENVLLEKEVEAVIKVEDSNGEAHVPQPTPEPSPEPTLEPTPEPTPEPAPEANPCTTCGGTGKCDECKGDGYRGSGYTVSCPRCHGSLTETCIYCDANGNSNKHAGTCDFPNCMGSHIYPCTTCGGGSTPVTCASCNGSGKCKTCGGSGTQ